MDENTKQDMPVKQRDIQPEAGRETGTCDNMNEPGDLCSSEEDKGHVRP